MQITIAEAIVDFNAQTASLQDWKNYSAAMMALKALNTPTPITNKDNLK